MLLQEKKAPVPTASKARFTASAQYVFLFILYHAKDFPMTKSELARRLSVNVMTATRAVRELAQLDLIHCQREGRSDNITPTCYGRELWEKARPYLMDPVTKKIFVRKEGLPENMPVGGLEALASVSMLAEPRISIRAMDKKAVDDYPLRQI